VSVRSEYQHRVARMVTDFIGRVC